MCKIIPLRVSCIVAFFSLPISSVSAQNANSVGLVEISLFLIVAVILLFAISLVANNLIGIEAKKRGIKDADHFSLLPDLNKLSGRVRPEFVKKGHFTRLRRGFNIKLEGEAAMKLEESRGNTFALQPSNFLGLSPIPKLVVQEGDEVKAGDLLFFDKKHPEIKFVAPVSGEIITINRGPKRSIKEIIILADKDQKYREIPEFNWDEQTRDAIIQFLLEYGSWPLIRQRPFNLIAHPDPIPQNIFISTFDTGPLSPDLNFVIQGQQQAFQLGLNILSKLTDGKVYLGLDANGKKPPSPVYTEATGVEKHWFKGPHPAGNVGVQAHHIHPISNKRVVWVLGVQEVVILGRIFIEHRYNTERIYAVTGSKLQDPKYVKTFSCPHIEDLVKEDIMNEHEVRIISGDVLSGKAKSLAGFIDFYDDQLTVIQEGDYYELFGWAIPVKPRPSVSRSYPNFIFPNLKYKGDTNTHGEKRAFVVTGEYEKVLPMDIYPQHLMKAIIALDFERMEGLGIYELVEEDIALCEFTCTSKQPLQQILREGLEYMQSQG